MSDRLLGGVLTLLSDFGVVGGVTLHQRIEGVLIGVGWAHENHQLDYGELRVSRVFYSSEVLGSFRDFISQVGEHRRLAGADCVRMDYRHSGELSATFEDGSVEQTMLRIVSVVGTLTEWEREVVLVLVELTSTLGNELLFDHDTLALHLGGIPLGAGWAWRAETPSSRRAISVEEFIRRSPYNGRAIDYDSVLRMYLQVRDMVRNTGVEVEAVRYDRRYQCWEIYDTRGNRSECR